MRVRMWMAGCGSVATAVMIACGLLLVPGTALATGDGNAEPDCVRAEQLGLVVIVDDSGSMDWNDPGDLRTEASVVALSQQTNGGVYALSTFSTEVHDVVAPTRLTNANRDGVEQTIRSRAVDFMGTDYEVAFVEAKRQLDAMPGSVDKKAVLFVSDGESNDVYSSDAVIAAAGIPIYTVGFGGVDHSELAGIAARSGGQTFSLTGASDLQPVAAKILAVLECNAQNIVQDVSLTPGETKSIPFNVAPTEDEFKALAAWSDGVVTASLTRPDGTTMNAQHVLANERWDESATFASGVGTNPQRGGWSFNLTASPANVAALDVTINVWGGDPNSTPAPEPEPQPEPEPPVVVPEPPVTPEPETPTQPTPPTTEIPVTRPAPASCSALVLEVGQQPEVLVSWTAAPSLNPIATGYVVETRPRGSNGNWKAQPFTSLLQTKITSAPGNSLDISVKTQFADGSVSVRCLVEAIVIPKVRKVLGTVGADVLVGSVGTDVITGGKGKDKLDGGAGNDTINGGADPDVMSGGSGNDVIDARDTSIDTIKCGSGKDKVLANTKDKVSVDCELVVRTGK